MSGRRFALIVAACLFAIFVGINLVSNVIFRGARLDLTENQLYTISQGTREVLAGLDEPIEFKLYVSREAAAHEPGLQAFSVRVRELLETYAANSNGNVRLTLLDPRPFTEEEEDALAAGIQAFPIQGSADPAYFGLVATNAVDETQIIPVFDPAREPFIEYDVTRIVQELQNPKRAKIGLITTLPIDPQLARTPMGAQMGQMRIAAELGGYFDVQTITPDFTAIPADIDVLVVLHPPPLAPDQLYAIDQFILRKGRAFIAIDPAAIISTLMGEDPMSPSMVPPASNMATLLDRWGVHMGEDAVLQLTDAFPVPGQGGAPMPWPLVFLASPDRMDRENMLTALFQRGIFFGAPGQFDISETDGIEATVLAHSDGDSMRIPAQLALSRPSAPQLIQNWAPQDQQDVLALQLTGTLQTAFPNGAPASPPVEGEAASAPARNAQHLTRSAGKASIVLVADVDFLIDQITAQADGGSFLLNAIDILTGSDQLVSLRARAPSLRPLTEIDRLETQADQRVRAKSEELQMELTRARQRLAELERSGRSSGYFRGDLGAELNQEEQAEIARVRREVESTGDELRAVGRTLRADVDNLKGWVMFVNIWLGPIIVAGVGIWVFWRRRRDAARQGHVGRSEPASGANA